jgi:hypothetical protein
VVVLGVVLLWSLRLIRLFLLLCCTLQVTTRRTQPRWPVELLPGALLWLQARSFRSSSAVHDAECSLSTLTCVTWHNQ